MVAPLVCPTDYERSRVAVTHTIESGHPTSDWALECVMPGGAEERAPSLPTYALLFVLVAAILMLPVLPIALLLARAARGIRP